MYEVRLKIRHPSLLLFGLFWVFDVVTPERFGDIAKSPLVLSATTLFEGEGKVISSDLHFVS